MNNNIKKSELVTGASRRKRAYEKHLSSFDKVPLIHNAGT